LTKPINKLLTISAGASVVGASSLAAAAAIAPGRHHHANRARCDLCRDRGAHRKACLEHTEAVRIQFAYEEHGGIQDERREEYERLVALTDVAWVAMADAGCALVNTHSTMLAGILALCRYIEPLFGETDQPDLPDSIDYEDDA
jgi:hypothetical protein